MLRDFRNHKKIIPPTMIGDKSILRVHSEKLLAVWLDDSLKHDTNTEWIIKKAANTLFLLKVLRNYDAP